MSDIRSQVKAFIIDNFMFGSGNGLSDNTSLLNEGIMDSTGALELITFLEETFQIDVEDEEMIPENLDSIDNVVAYLARKGLQAGAVQ